MHYTDQRSELDGIDSVEYKLGRMSNNSLIDRIESALDSVRSRDCAPQLLAEAIRNNGRALERMPYPLIKEMESLAMDLDIALWQDEDGFLPDIASTLTQVQSWLGKLPRDAA